jgi:hypothetical protein
MCLFCIKMPIHAGQESVLFLLCTRAPMHEIYKNWRGSSAKTQFFIVNLNLYKWTCFAFSPAAIGLSCIGQTDTKNGIEIVVVFLRRSCARYIFFQSCVPCCHGKCRLREGIALPMCECMLVCLYTCPSDGIVICMHAC